MNESRGQRDAEVERSLRGAPVKRLNTLSHGGATSLPAAAPSWRWNRTRRFRVAGSGADYGSTLPGRHISLSPKGGARLSRKILYSPGFGAGWASWNSGETAKYMLEYQPIIEFLEGGGEFTEHDIGGSITKYKPRHPLLIQLNDECTKRFGAHHVCVLGATDLKVAKVSGRVRIDEYDGSETYVEEGCDEGWM